MRGGFVYGPRGGGPPVRPYMGRTFRPRPAFDDGAGGPPPPFRGGGRGGFRGLFYYIIIRFLFSNFSPSKLKFILLNVKECGEKEDYIFIV